MKILFLGIFALSIIAIINVGTIYAQYGGPVMGPSATISDVATSANNVYVTWNGEDQDTKSPAAFLKSSNDNGASFGKTINLAQYGASPHDLFRPNVNMASSENNLYLAWSDWKPNTLDSDIFFMKSSDGASTFDKPFKIKTGNGISTVVSISSSEDNVYVLMYNNTDSDYSDLLLVTSNDNGETFGKPLSISTNHKLMIGNVQMLTFKNNIYIVASGSYWGSQNGVVMYYASNDSGKSFLPVTIADEVLAFIPQVGVSGNDVYVIWTQMVERGSALFFEKSVDGGVSFGNKLQINQDGDSRWPQMIVSQNNVFVKWVQSFPSGGDKLLLSKSTDKGNTFSAPLNLGGYTAGFDFSQIGILENGNMFAVWTGEDDPSYSHSGIFFRKSTDGGATFGDIYDLNVASKTAILNPKIALIQNNIYVAGDSGSAGIDDITFRASSDSGNTFTGPTNLNSDEPVQSSNPSQLVPIPQFKPDIPTGVPANSQFSNSQNASFVLGQLDFMSNSANPTASTFSAPHFVAFDSQGNLWVSDGGNDRVLEFAPPFTIGKSASVVLGQKDFTSWQVLNGTNPRSLYHPQGLAFDKEGNLWVADGASNRILEFEPPFKTGQVPSLVLGQKDFGIGDYPQSDTSQLMYYPEGIAFDPDGNLWVADTNNKLLEFKHPFSNGQDAALTLGNITQNSGVTASTINSPLGIAFDKDGNLWVADSGSYRILRFNAPFSDNQDASLVLGHQDFTTGGEGVASGASSFRDPYGITFDSQGNLWVADSGNNRVLEFVPPFTNDQNASLLLGQTSFNAGAIDSAGHTINSLYQPHGMAFDKYGNLWVVDSANNRILAYKSNQSTNSQIVFPDSNLNSSQSKNANLPNAYEQAANQMVECSKKLGISSDNQTAINLVLGSSEFKSQVQGYDYKPNGIANSFHLCTLDTVEAVYSLYDKDGKYVKSLYVSIDPSLTKILGIREEAGGAQYGGVSAGLASTQPILSPLKQFKSGIAANDIKCEQGLQLVIKAEDGSPSCVKPQTVQKLVEHRWGWAMQAIDSIKPLRPNRIIGLENDTGVATLGNQTYYFETPNYTETAYVSHVQVSFHDVVFTLFPSGFRGGLPDNGCGGQYYWTDAKFSDGTSELLHIFPITSMSQQCLALPEPTHFSTHTNPQAGLTFYDGKMKLLVSMEEASDELVKRGWAQSVMVPSKRAPHIVKPLNPINLSPCETRYEGKPTSTSTVYPNGTVITTGYVPVLYMPQNSTGMICVNYTNVNQQATAQIRIFEANNLSRQADIQYYASPDNISKGNSTVVYTISTGNQRGFYGISFFCGGMPFAVGYDNQSRIITDDFPWIGQVFHCPSMTYTYKISGLHGVGIYYIKTVSHEQLSYDIQNTTITSYSMGTNSHNATFSLHIRTFDKPARFWFDYKDSTATKFVKNPGFKFGSDACNWDVTDNSQMQNTPWLRIDGIHVKENSVTIPANSNGTYTFSILAENLSDGYYGLSPVVYGATTDVSSDDAGTNYIAYNFPLVTGIGNTKILDFSGTCLR